MDSVSPNEESSAPLVHRPWLRRVIAAGVVCVLGIVLVPLAMWMTSGPSIQSDAYLVTWQALLDEEAAKGFLKPLEEMTGQDRAWAIIGSQGPSSAGSPELQEKVVKGTLYKGAGDQVRATMREVRQSQAKSFAMDHLQLHKISDFRIRGSAMHPVVSIMRLFSRVNMVPSPTSSGMLAFGHFSGKELHDWQEANRNHFYLNPNVRYTASFTPSNALTLEVHGEVRVNNFKFQGDKAPPENALAKMDCRALLKAGDVAVLVARFPQKLPGPVMVIVCERADLPPGRNDITMQQSMKRWLEGGPDLVRKTSDALQDWERRAPQEQIVPGASWTQKLPDGTALTLVAVNFSEKYPGFQWTPEGKPLPRMTPNHGVVVRGGKSVPRVLFRFAHHPAAEIATQAITAVDLASQGVRSTGDVAYSMQDPDLLSMSQDVARAQFVSLPGEVQADGKGGVDVAAGYGSWKPLVKIPAETPAQRKPSDPASPFHIHAHEHDTNGMGFLDVSIAPTQEVASEGELRLVLITKSGDRILGDYPPGLWTGREAQRLSRSTNQRFGGYKKKDVDHYEVETRPVKTLHFGGFVVEPEELKKKFGSDTSAGK